MLPAGCLRTLALIGLRRAAGGGWNGGERAARPEEEEEKERSTDSDWSGRFSFHLTLQQQLASNAVTPRHIMSLFCCSYDTPTLLAATSL